MPDRAERSSSGSYRFPAEPASVVEVRQFLCTSLQPLANEIDLDAMVLMGEELVSNAIRRADGPDVEVEVEISHGSGRIGIRNWHPTSPAMHHSACGYADGPGLRPMDRWAYEWGATQRGDGRWVPWFRTALA